VATAVLRTATSIVSATATVALASARNRTANSTSNRNHDSTANSTSNATIASAATRSPHPHRDSTAPHRDRDRTSSSPASAEVLRTAHLRLPRARATARAGQSAKAHATPVTRATTAPESERMRSAGDRNRAVSERQRVTCPQFGRSAVGEVRGRYCDRRILTPRTLHRVTTSDHTTGRRIHRVGLKGAGGLVREPNETLESFALQNSRLSPDAGSRARPEVSPAVGRLPCRPTTRD
jgi:hypothetical protein